MSNRKTIREVVVALGQKYDGPTKSKGDFTYIEWHEVARVMDRIFGPTYWSSEPILFVANPEQGLYTAAVKVTASAIDDETGEVVTFSRDGFNTAFAQPTKEERDRGILVTQDYGLHTTAADGAGSLAFVKGTKKLGDAFGLYLYQKENQRSRPSYDGAPRSNGNGGGSASSGTRKGPSEKQLKVLVNNGYPEDFVETLDFKDWKGIVDDIFAGNTPKIQPPAKASNNGRATARPSARDEEPDEIPF